MDKNNQYHETKQIKKNQIKELFGYEIGDIRQIELPDGSKEYFYLDDINPNVSLNWKKAESYQIDNHFLKRLAKSLNNYYTVEEVDGTWHNEYSLNGEESKALKKFINLFAEKVNELKRDFDGEGDFVSDWIVDENSFLIEAIINYFGKVKSLWKVVYEETE